jgi:head-tail adaptor
MVKALTHPKLLQNLANFYPAVCTIQSRALAADTFGGQAETWSNVGGLVGIACAVAAMTGKEIKLPDETYVMNPFRIALAGDFPQITEAMRVTSGGVTYDILSVQSDSQSKATYLTCQVVK